MALPQLDANHMDLNTIMRLIGGYSSPEAAESDILFNAPQARGKMKEVYQQATGDFTGDPFAAFSKAQAADWNQKAGDQWSNRVRAMQMAPDGGGDGGGAAPSVSVPISGATTPNSNETAYLMRHPEQQYLSELANPATQEIASSQFIGPTMPGARVPYISQVDSDPSSVGYGLDEHLLADPKFATLQSRDPEQAKKTYEALTGGQDLNKAIAVLGARRKDREALHDQVVRELATTIDFDPVTGQLGKRKINMKDDGLGSTPTPVTTFVPLNPVEHELLSNGTFTRKTGIDLNQFIQQKQIEKATASPYLKDIPDNKKREAQQEYEKILKETGNTRAAELGAKRKAEGYSPTLERAKEMLRHFTTGNAMRGDIANTMHLPSRLGNLGKGVADTVYDQFRKMISPVGVLPEWHPEYENIRNEREQFNQVLPWLKPQSETFPGILPLTPR